jgi:transcriptional regulator with XRE-family HTH domain
MQAQAQWFAGRLKELRERAGLTQPELAERAGLSKDGIAHLEQGRREPAWATVLTLCQALGVDCSAFAQPPAKRPPQGRGRPKPPPPAPTEDCTSQRRRRSR